MADDIGAAVVIGALAGALPGRPGLPSFPDGITGQARRRRGYRPCHAGFAAYVARK